MSGRQIISTPRPGLIRIQVFGERAGPEAQKAAAAFFELHHANPQRRHILFDATEAEYLGPPEDLYVRVARYGRELPPGKVAILTHDLGSVYARFWRRGLADTGHETAVFTCAREAEAWLESDLDADTLFVA
ncbi:hypothetical protein F1654_06905 [Alkalicaulis satelles]|uniref:STAS/SEC14 domain-containing protein n=1 Tax=Alkalicaulis satelles TaxID=2609175 RepID=A0A5M6ZFM6_9PROT|nr:hypothetical protein [Alkalicaulis satelles]KAA5803529.1 hypothetical protein F1654_06905 [Alkalicaulis satelles]